MKKSIYVLVIPCENEKVLLFKVAISCFTRVDLDLDAEFKRKILDLN